MDSNQMLFLVAAGDVLERSPREADLGTSPNILAPRSDAIQSFQSLRLINNQNARVRFQLSTSRPFAIVRLTGRSVQNSAVESARMDDHEDGWYSLQPQAIATVCERVVSLVYVFMS